ncbi:DUF4423 domain-containing protein [Peredibacter starrii]|uniref:DUF4423 domain-containing protein n=1 Tax=Peredibacter starrii TaxID=28202 RepID=A0AAX4HUJ7_9BACT|nr:DUF4423 domain-containing protein [Peredibacter starrii]WPU66624.1 DUF4423 domain-containing protein [Peredibacter starrii]
MNNIPFYSRTLKEGLKQKQSLNPKYSLRAYARDLNIHPSILSLAIKGERTLTEKDAQLVLNKLQLTPENEILFRNSMKSDPSVIDKVKINRHYQRQVFILESDFHEPIITDWEFMACLELFDFKDFEVTIDNVSKKLNISMVRAKEVLDILVEKKLIMLDEELRYQKIHVNVSTTADVPSQAIRQSHYNALEMAKEKLKTTPMELRDYSTITLAIDPNKLVEVKSMIRDFRQKIISLMNETDRSEVYRFSFQVFPLSAVEDKEEVKD